MALQDIAGMVKYPRVERFKVEVNHTLRRDLLFILILGLLPPAPGTDLSSIVNINGRPLVQVYRPFDMPWNPLREMFRQGKLVELTALFANTVHMLVTDLECHEVDEWLTIAGERIVEPTHG